MRTAIVLFTRDLRVHDNPAFTTAAHEAERIVPLFVFDDAIIGSVFAPPNRVTFRLVLRSGDVIAEMIALAREVGAEGVVVAEDASGYAQRRQRRLEHACSGDRIALRVTPGVTVAPRGSKATPSTIQRLPAPGRRSARQSG